jgi:hypothetical protein
MVCVVTISKDSPCYTCTTAKKLIQENKPNELMLCTCAAYDAWHASKWGPK